jgi:hypothetical protein
MARMIEDLITVCRHMVQQGDMTLKQLTVSAVNLESQQEQEAFLRSTMDIDETFERP